MEAFRLFASPWWVNLLPLVPLLAYGWWRRRGLELSPEQLLLAALFATAFGFVEGAVVVYLRAAVGLLPGYQGTLADVARLSSGLYQQTQSVRQLPPSLLTVEVVREAATLLMLVSVSLLAARTFRERCALFLWCFASGTSPTTAACGPRCAGPPPCATPTCSSSFPCPGSRRCGSRW